MVRIGMGLLQELFEDAGAEAPPPEVGRWQYILDHHQARLAVEFVRRREGLGYGPARLIVSFVGANPPMPPDPPIHWDVRVNRWLIEHGARAQEPRNESERFGFALRDDFEPVERDCGSGYFNSILVAYLVSSGLAELPPIQDKLVKVHSYRPEVSKTSARYLDGVKRAITSAARALKALAYPEKEAIDILGDAIAYYLDERFNISTRELLGFG